MAESAGYRSVIVATQYATWLLAQLLRLRYSVRANCPSGLFERNSGHCLILAANHRTYFDLGLLMIAVGFRNLQALAPIRTLGALDFRSPILTSLKPLIRIIYWLEGVIPLPPEKESDRSLPEKLRGMLVALSNGEVAAIFPEGELWKEEDPPVGDFAPGVVYLHRKSAATILPIGVWISDRRWPRRRYVAELGWPVTIPEDLDQAAGAAWLRQVVIKLYDQAEQHGRA